MARKIRVEYAGSVYHVMALGNQGRTIYAEDSDRKVWLETLAEACAETGWRIHAFVMRVKDVEFEKNQIIVRDAAPSCPSFVRYLLFRPSTLRPLRPLREARPAGIRLDPVTGQTITFRFFVIFDLDSFAFRLRK
jgi:hypothetical protein